MGRKPQPYWAASNSLMSRKRSLPAQPPAGKLGPSLPVQVCSSLHLFASHPANSLFRCIDEIEWLQYRTLGVSCTNRGWPDAMSAKTKFSVRPRRTNFGPRARAHFLNACPQKGRISKSCAAVLILLAMGVALCGCAYKFSRYDLQSDPASRVLFAKLWDKHDDAEQLARQAELTAHSSFVPPLQVAGVLLDTPLVVQGFLFNHSGKCKRPSVLFRSDISLRAPPSRTLLA